MNSKRIPISNDLAARIQEANQAVSTYESVLAQLEQDEASEQAKLVDAHLRNQENAVEYEGNQPKCVPERVGANGNGEPVYQRFYRVYPNQAAPTDNAAMKAARLALKRACDVAEIPETVSLLFVGEEIPAAWAERARRDGGVFTHTTTDLREKLAISLDLKRAEIIVPLSLAVEDICEQVMAQVFYFTARSGAQPPPMEEPRGQRFRFQHAVVEFRNPMYETLLDLHISEWERSLMAEAKEQARTEWKGIKHTVQREAGFDD